MARVSILVFQKIKHFQLTVYRLSISFIYILAYYTDILGEDPILWFTMMLMPTGPPSLLISGLAELANMSEVDRMATVKALTVSEGTI